MKSKISLERVALYSSIAFGLSLIAGWIITFIGMGGLFAGSQNTYAIASALHLITTSIFVGSFIVLLGCSLVWIFRKIKNRFVK